MSSETCAACGVDRWLPENEAGLILDSHLTQNLGHTFVPAPSPDASTQEFWDERERQINAIEDAPSTTVDLATEMERTPTAEAEAELLFPSTTDAVKAARETVLFEIATVHPIECARYGNESKDGTCDCYIGDALNDFEAVIVDREKKRYEAVVGAVVLDQALDTTRQYAHTLKAEARIEALEAVVKAAQQWIPAGSQADFLLAALDKPQSGAPSEPVQP